jgi:hypothetical protein
MMLRKNLTLSFREVDSSKGSWFLRDMTHEGLLFTLQLWMRDENDQFNLSVAFHIEVGHGCSKKTVPKWCQQGGKAHPFNRSQQIHSAIDLESSSQQISRYLR